jgi:hypothetical protein
VRNRPVGHAIWISAVRHAGARRSSRRRTVGSAVTRHATVTGNATRRNSTRGDSTRGDSTRGDSTRREPAWLARMRAPRLAESLLAGRHFAGATQQLPVVVFLGVYRPG